MNRGAWWAIIHWVARVGHNWSDWAPYKIDNKWDNLLCSSGNSTQCSVVKEIQKKGIYIYLFSSVQSLSHVRLCNPMNRSTPGLPVHHQLPEFTQTHVHRVGDAIQPSYPLLSPSPPAPNPSQHQGLFQWVNSSHEVAKVLEFQLPR